VKKLELVRLKLATSPESRFVASWEGGSRTGQTPRAIKVPKGAEVHIRFVKDGFQSAETAITLSKDEVVFKALTPAP
jgi:hypothetical protein